MYIYIYIYIYTFENIYVCVNVNSIHIYGVWLIFYGMSQVRNFKEHHCERQPEGHNLLDLHPYIFIYIHICQIYKLKFSSQCSFINQKNISELSETAFTLSDGKKQHLLKMKRFIQPLLHFHWGPIYSGKERLQER